MKEITLTLTLPIKEAGLLIDFIETLNVKTIVEETVKEVVKETPTKLQPPVVTKPTAGKVTKMPTFGRTQAQIDEFAEQEAARVEKLTEKELLKEQRDADRDAKKAAKELEANAKKEEEEHAAAEVEKIKAAIDPIEVTKPSIKKPWEL